MPPSSRRQPVPPNTPACRRILAAAEACFGNLGFQKTSVTEIAVAAQVSKRWHDRLLRLSGKVYGAYMNELLMGTGRKQTKIVSGEHRFLKRRLDDEFQWTPTDGEIAEMVRLARLR